MENEFNNRLLEDYQEQVNCLLTPDELAQRDTYIFYEVYEVGGANSSAWCCVGCCVFLACGVCVTGFDSDFGTTCGETSGNCCLDMCNSMLDCLLCGNGF